MLLNHFQKKMKKDTSISVLSPITGDIVDLRSVNDGVFSEGNLGVGCAIKPLKECIYAPFDAEITHVADTLHALCVSNSDGVELLIHIGLDTVDLHGKGFKMFHKKGDFVQCGEPLLNFSHDTVFPDATKALIFITITNSHDFSKIDISPITTVKHGEMLMSVYKKPIL